MSYVLFNLETTITVKDKYHIGTKLYKTEGAAKAERTRLTKKGKLKAEEYGVLPVAEFAKIEKMETKKNLLSGHEFTQSVNTPLCCDPSSETYHSM